MLLWVARAVWLVLAFTSAAELDDALGEWSSTPRLAVAALAWALWAVALLALLAPRPWGFTVLRVAVSAAAITAIVAAFSVPFESWVAALVVAAAAAAVVTGSAVAHACARGSAYGYEARFPLRAPFALLIGGIPVVAALIVIGAGAGAVLMADGRWVQGILALVIGIPFAALLARALHGLSLRWLVTVPAGFVIVDPSTLTDPLLIPESAVLDMQAAPNRAPQGALDLRLGTAFGSLMISTPDPKPIPRRTGRNETSNVEADRILVAPLRPSAFQTALKDRPRVRD